MKRLMPVKYAMLRTATLSGCGSRLRMSKETGPPDDGPVSLFLLQGNDTRKEGLSRAFLPGRVLPSFRGLLPLCVFRLNDYSPTTKRMGVAPEAASTLSSSMVTSSMLRVSKLRPVKWSSLSWMVKCRVRR